MGSLFQLEGPLFRILSRIGDLVMLNLLFILFALPMITAGASFQAMDQVLLQVIGKEDPPIVKSFWKAFRYNFFQSTKVWLFFVFCAMVLIVDAILTKSMYSPFRQIFLYLCVVFGIVLGSMMMYVFPLVSRFENSTRRTILNSLLLAIGHAPKTMMMLFCWLLPIVFVGLDFGLIIYAIVAVWLIGFSGIRYLNCIIINGIFKQIEGDNDDDN